MRSCLAVVTVATSVAVLVGAGMVICAMVLLVVVLLGLSGLMSLPSWLTGGPSFEPPSSPHEHK